MRLLPYIFIIFILHLDRGNAQEMPAYTVELDVEMHYKINASNWQERGAKEFKEDVRKLLEQIDIQNKSQGFSVFCEIIFNEKAKPSLGLFDTSIRLRNHSLH